MCTRREVMSLPVFCEYSKDGCKETPLWKNLKVCRHFKADKKIGNLYCHFYTVYHMHVIKNYRGNFKCWKCWYLILPSCRNILKNVNIDQWSVMNVKKRPLWIICRIIKKWSAASVWLYVIIAPKTFLTVRCR